MNILMLLDEEFPPDSRVQKEIASLTQEGHYVYLVCSSFENRAKFEKEKGWEIHRLLMPKMPWRKMKVTVISLPFYRKKWLRFIRLQLGDVQFDCVHVHDLPLAQCGYELSKFFHAKLVLDQHEYYSDWIVKTAHMNTFLGKIILYFSDWKRFEKKYLNKADQVITVAEPLRKNYINEHCVPDEKIITIPNTPLLSLFNQQNVNKELTERFKDDFVLFYAGGIDILRGIDLVIEAIPEIQKSIPNVKVVLGGKIVKPYDPFQKADELQVKHRIEFIGWINEKDLPSYIAASDVCFFTPQSNRDEINNTIATKIYQYAAMAKPQIVSEVKMMKKYVEENELGYSISTSKEFAEKVIDIAKGKHSRLQMKIDKVLGWEDTVKPMIRYYSSI